MEEERFLGIFTKECLQLCDISPSIACKIIYGSWSVRYPYPGINCLSFDANHYLRYSEDARREVVLALIKCGRQQELLDICRGYKGLPHFLKELELWKKWGVDSHLISREQEDSQAYNIATAFAAIMDYINKKLTPVEASNWLRDLGSLFEQSSIEYELFKQIIDKHTAY